MKQHDEAIEIDGSWVYPDGVRLPVLSGAEGDEGTDGGEGGESAPAEGGESADGGGETAETEGGETTTTTTTETETTSTEGAVDETDLVAVLQSGLIEGDLADAETEEIERLNAAIDAEIEAARANPDAVTMDDITRFQGLRAVQTNLAAEVQRRIDEAAATATALEEIAGNVVTLPSTPSETTPAVPAAQAASPSAPPAPPAAPSAPVVDRAAHAAAMHAIRERANPTQDPAAAESHAARAASPGVVAQQAAAQWVSLRAADPGVADFGRMVNQTRPVSMFGGEIQPRDESILAAAVIEADPELQLTDSRSHNEGAMSRAIQAHREAREEAATARNTKVAAICTPAQIIREAMQCGTDAVPLQGALVNMNAVSGNANNLSYSYRLPTSINEAAAGVGAWTATNQGNVVATDPTTWKPCVAIACPGYADEIASEFTACFTVDAFTELSSPEQVADFEQAKDRAFARFTEAWMLRKLDTYLYHVSHTATLGAVPDIIDAVLTALANGHFGERMDLEAGYVVFGSPGLAYAAAIDENSKAYGDGSSLDTVMGIVREATGTDYVQLYDLPLTGAGNLPANPFGSLGVVGASGATPLPTIGGGVITYQLRVIDPSSFIGFNTGEATFGQQITLDQARQNKRGFFQRVFGGLMKPGCAPGYRIDITLCHDGSRGGFVEPSCGTGGGS